MRLLIVKTSSMGDVVHATPAVSDIVRRHPGARIDWLVEAAFAAIPRMHPGVQRVLPMAWRRWRRQLLRADTWRAMSALRADLRREPYDLVLDLQGLVVSCQHGARNVVRHKADGSLEVVLGALDLDAMAGDPDRLAETLRGLL